MTPLLGGRAVTLDDKGRLAIPSDLRSLIPPDVGKLAIINAMDGCLAVYPLNEIEHLVDRFRSNRFFAEKKGRTFMRRLFRGSSVETLDSQGRLALSPAQIEHAGLTKKSPAIVTGLLDRIEIWNPERLEANEESVAASIEDLAEEFFAPPKEG